MSSTLRTNVRASDDFYETPAWCVARLLEAVALPGGDWVDAGAGRGAIAHAVNALRNDVSWALVEYDAERAKALASVRSGHVFIGRFESFPGGRSVVISNPPFGQALDFVRHAFTVAPITVMLLRLNFLASAERAPFMHATTPDVYVLPNRPSFTDDGKTDSPEYAWFVWCDGKGEGRVRVLNTTPKEERRR